jgi:hypothetical protein
MFPLMGKARGAGDVNNSWYGNGILFFIDRIPERKDRKKPRKYACS